MELPMEHFDFGARFWERVDVRGQNECWPWTGKPSRTQGGYGRFAIKIGEKFKNIGSHRWAFYFSKGHWPRFACHKCDNPMCCNPNHIYDGTPKTNMEDRSNRKRVKFAIGSNHGRSKLSEEDVITIRDKISKGQWNGSSAMTEYGISRAMVSLIINRKNWTHV